MKQIGSIIEAEQSGSVTPSINSQSKQRKEKACLPDTWILALFKKFQARYLHRWTSAIEGIEKLAMQEWSQVLHGLTGEQIKNGIDRLVDGWPPSATEFRTLCLSGSASCPAHKHFAKALPKPEVNAEFVESHIDEMRIKLNND